MFSCEYCEILRTSFFIEHLRWLLPDLFLACGSSRLEVFCKKGVLRNFTKLTGKHKKEKKDFPTQVFSCEFCKIYKNSFSYRIPPLATSNRVPPLHFPIENIIENEYSKLIYTWYFHCFKSCYTEAVVRRCSQNLQENTCVRVSFLIKLQAWGQMN